MKLKHLMLSSVLAIPALLLPLASCDDSKNAPTAPTDDPAANADAPSFTSVGFGARSHDPHIPGPKIRCFQGADVGVAFGQCKRFRTKDGAEVNTIDGDQDPNNNAAGVVPADTRYRGKLLTDIREVDFSYAGGNPSGGTPRWSIPIDCKQSPEYVGVTVAPCETDGVFDFTAFIAADRCNDGDANVGVVNGEDDESCFVDAFDGNFPNWTAFENAHPGGRIARMYGPEFNNAAADAFVILDQPAHYLIFNVRLR